MAYRIARRVPAGWSELRWCILRDNQIIIHREHEHDCRELLPIMGLLDPQPTPLTQEAIDKRPNVEPQGTVRKLLWRAFHA